MERLLTRILKNFPFPPRIFIYGGYGYKNIGDEAILAGLLQIIRRCFKDAKITVVSGDPKETRMMHNVNSISPLNLNILKEIIKSNMIILGGGGIVSRVISYGYKYKIFCVEGKLIHIIAIISKLFNKPVLYYGISATSIPDPLTKFFAKLGMQFADIIVTRDYLSKKIIEKFLCIKKKIIVEPDLAFDMEVNDNIEIQDLLNKENIDPNKFLIAITLRLVENKETNKIILETITYVIKHLFDVFDEKIEIIFIPMSRRTSKLGEIGKNDMVVLNELKKRLKNNYKIKFIKGQYHPMYIKQLIDRCDFLIGMRLHSVIFAYLTNTPCIAIEYDEKVTEFLRFVNNPSYIMGLKPEMLRNREYVTRKILNFLRSKIKSKVM